MEVGVIGRCVLALALAAALLPAAAVAKPAPGSIDAALAKAYGPYYTESGGESDWDRPVWSASTRRLIQAWKRHIGEELTGLSDYGWFCDCQDWYWKQFNYRRIALRQKGQDRAEVTVRVRVMRGAVVAQRLAMVREGKRWVIDDLFNDSEPKGVKASLRRELREKPGE